MHRYIMSFARAAQTAGYEVVALQQETLSPPLVVEAAVISLRRGRGLPIAFRAWVETRLTARGTREEYGYVEQVHDPRTGRARLVDWTTLSTRAEFRMDANGAGKELATIFRKPRGKRR